MSASIIRAHGGSKDLLGKKGQIVSPSLFVTDTKVGKMKSASDAHLGYLITNTTGEPQGSPVMHGVLTSTKQGLKDMDVPELHKSGNKGKTQPKKQGMVPFSGPKY
jgi:hypothetical protein